MARIKLLAAGSAEKKVLEYLDGNASEALAEKINSGKKTLSGALEYCKDRAKGMSRKGVACVDDETVFGWVVHYFEEEAVSAEKKAAARADSAKVPGKKDWERRPKDVAAVAGETVECAKEGGGGASEAVGDGAAAGGLFEGLDLFGGSKK